MKNIGTIRGLNSNPADLHVYRKGQHPENTTPAEQPMVVLNFNKHLMSQTSLLPLTLLPLTSVNGQETGFLTTGLQPHSIWRNLLTLIKSANRQLKQTAIKQTACPDFSEAIRDFTIGLNMLNRIRITHYSILTANY